MHEGERYPCEKCDYKARERGSLRQHIKPIHEGERYTCEKCDYKATQKGSLRQHIKSIYEGERLLIHITGLLIHIREAFKKKAKFGNCSQ